MPRVSRALLVAVIPIAVTLALLIPRQAPLDPLMLPVQGLFMGIFLYNLALVFFGVRTPPPAPGVAPRSRLAVLVAAHNEEPVIGHLISSLRAQDYPAEHFAVCVAADHCTDGTAAAARAAGARVFERHTGRGGKGPALEWLMERVLALDEGFDAVVIFDADNLVARAFLRAVDARLQRGEQVIQGYLATKNPNDSWITRAIYIAYVNSNRFFQLAKTNAGFSSALGGTGLCIAVPLLRRLGWRCDSLTEDLEFQARAVLAGIRPTWAWEAAVYDEKPLTLRGALRQRHRWMQGHASVALRYAPRCFARAVAARDPVAWDAALYLITPFLLSFAVLSPVIVTLGGAWWTPLYPVWLPPVLYVGVLVLPYVALRLEGLSTGIYLTPSTLAGCIVLAAVWPILGLLGVLHHRRLTWNKTVHTRSVTLHETARQQAALADQAPRAIRLEGVRLITATLITLTLVATVTPHLVAKRLRPPLEEGALLLLEGRPQQALDLFLAGVEEQPDDPIAHGFLALTYRMLGRPFNALRAYARLRQLDPQLGDTVVAIVDVLLRHRSHPKAETVLRELLSMVRSGAEAYAWVANQFSDRRRLAQAEMIVRNGLKRYGPQLPLLRVQGYLHLVRGRYPEAVAALREAARRAPRDPSLLINLGWAHFRQGQLDQTIQVWERALALDPRNEALRRDLAWVRRLRQRQALSP